MNAVSDPIPAPQLQEFAFRQHMAQRLAEQDRASEALWTKFEQELRVSYPCDQNRGTYTINKLENSKQRTWLTYVTWHFRRLREHYPKKRTGQRLEMCKSTASPAPISTTALKVLCLFPTASKASSSTIPDRRLLLRLKGLSAGTHRRLFAGVRERQSGV